jgi:pyruvate/2-oxoglutarate dehydrogenase complex dihydrolipoamide acyltransferase (E2) component
MSKLLSPMSGRIKEINVKVGSIISKDDELLVLEEEKREKETPEQPWESEEFPQYRMLYEYLTSRYFTAI